MSADLGNVSVISPTDASNGSGTMPSWLGSAAPSTLDDAGRALQGAVAREWQARSYTTSSGTAPNFVVAYTVAPAALRSGQTYTFTAHAAAVGSDDVNINTLGAKAIKKVVAGVKTALAANDFYTGDKIAVTYDGTDMVWTNPKATAVGSATTSAEGISELLTTTEVLTGTDTTRTATADSIAALWEAGSDVADGAAITIGEGGYFNLITSTTAITSFSITTDKAGRTFRVRFNTARTLTHNATSLIIPGGANVTTAQGDIAQIRSLGSGNVVVEWYTKADGTPLVASPSTGVTLLGTIDTSSGTSATLGSLTLTSYKFLKLVFNGVSASGAASFLIGNSTSDDVAISTATAGTGGNIIGHCIIDLATGIATSITFINGGSTTPIAVTTAITTSTTTISIAPSAGNLDAGSVAVYGMK